MGYTVDSTRNDCYPGTTVLVNRFGLQTQGELDAVEAALVTAKATQWENEPQCSSFDLAHYRAIHRFLFGELYDWAGELRTINLSKKGTQFCPVRELQRVSKAIFDRLAEKKFLQGLPREELVSEIADLYERTNELHPFREGNGRTQRVFLAQLAENAGYRLDFAAIDPDELMIATILSVQGIEEPLKKAFEQIVVE